MFHETSLVATIVVGLGLAFVLAAIANRLKVSLLVGYLLAGVAVGPFAPGFVADQKLAAQLAEIGVILLMFGVGLHFSTKDLLAMRRVAVPGALVQIAGSTLLGMAVAWLMGWSMAAGFVFGLALSIASTVVLMRALQERRLLDSGRGRVAASWLTERARDLILGASMLSILLNPLLFAAKDRLRARLQPANEVAPQADAEVDLPVTSLEDHIVLVGYGRVGSIVGERLHADGVKLFVIDESPATVERLRMRRFESIVGNAANGAVGEREMAEAMLRMVRPASAQPG